MMMIIAMAKSASIPARANTSRMRTGGAPMSARRTVEAAIAMPNPISRILMGETVLGRMLLTDSEGMLSDCPLVLPDISHSSRKSQLLPVEDPHCCHEQNGRGSSSHDPVPEPKVDHAISGVYAVCRTQDAVEPRKTYYAIRRFNGNPIEESDSWGKGRGREIQIANHVGSSLGVLFVVPHPHLGT